MQSFRGSCLRVLKYMSSILLMISKAMKFMRASFGSEASIMINRLITSVAIEDPNYIKMRSKPVEKVLSPLILTKFSVWLS